VSGPAKLGGVGPQGLMEPLTDLASRVQYPLGTPFRGDDLPQSKLVRGVMLFWDVRHEGPTRVV